jgi:hypothetical protein
MAFSMQGGDARFSTRDWNGRRNQRGERGLVNRHANSRSAQEKQEQASLLKRYRDAAHVTEQRQHETAQERGLASRVMGRLASVFGFGKGAR